MHALRVLQTSGGGDEWCAGGRSTEEILEYIVAVSKVEVEAATTSSTCGGAGLGPGQSVGIYTSSPPWNVLTHMGSHTFQPLFAIGVVFLPSLRVAKDLCPTPVKRTLALGRCNASGRLASIDGSQADSRRTS